MIQTPAGVDLPNLTFLLASKMDKKEILRKTKVMLFFDILQGHAGDLCFHLL